MKIISGLLLAGITIAYLRSSECTLHRISEGPIRNQGSSSSGLSPDVTAFKPLPLPVSGSCQAGKQYTINSIGDLYELIPEIECVWTQALVPNKVPLGACYGRLLTYANTAFIDPFIEFIYQGDYLVQTRCGDQYYHIGLLNFAGKDVSTGIWTISSLPEKYSLMEGEQYDGRAGVLMDFTVDIDEYCPLEGDSPPIWPGFSPFKTGRWPYRLFIDMLRFVGRDTDNCALLLGRTWMLDPADESAPLYTVLYFVLKSCDPNVLYEVKRNTPLPPLSESFTYNRAGAFEFFDRLNPVNFYLGEKAGTNPNGIYDYNLFTSEPPTEAPTVGDDLVIPAGEYQLKLDPVSRTIIDLIDAIIHNYSGRKST